ncbi:Protein-lysine N-methyltransferase EFM6 [Pseudozyma hubeiensis]|nr:Protein-lysine N-methyltransferase EFM6 [Pseudozyma hubeiensis]
MPSDLTPTDVQSELILEEQLDLVDPLRHFLAIDDEPSTPPTSTDVRDLPSTTDYSIVPQQIESIIDRRTTIRYYRDLSRKPILIDEQHPAPPDGDAGKEWWDVHLKLDMTTGCGGKIWPAAEVLGAYIAGRYSFPGSGSSAKAEGVASANPGFNNHNFDWRNKRIVELGSGTGLVGFLVHALHSSNCTISVTDQDVMLPLMRDNLALNFPSSNDSISVAELNWGTPLPPIFADPLPDVLLLADCVYLESAFQPLIDTMLDLSTKETEILFCYQKRRKADKRFFGLLKKGFVFEDVKDDDEVRCREYQRQGTQLLRIRRK